MSVSRILFFIFMPLVYKLLEASFEENYFKKMNKGRFIFEIFQVFLYYIIEVIYMIVHHIITNEWIFMKDKIYKDCFGFFVFLSIVFICFSLMFSTEIEDFICYHICKSFILVVLYLIFIVIVYSFISFDVEKKTFNNMDYEKVNEQTINLRAFSDTTSVSGDTKTGRFYISGKIQENYELYYGFMDEDGSLVIRHFTYNESNCKIFPEENCTQPRIEITTYAKSYKDNYSSYCCYVLHIPDDSITDYELDLH